MFGRPGYLPPPRRTGTCGRPGDKPCLNHAANWDAAAAKCAGVPTALASGSSGKPGGAGAAAVCTIPHVLSAAGLAALRKFGHMAMVWNDFQDG